MTFIPLIYLRAVLGLGIMPQEPMSYFGWLMNCCVSDELAAASERRTAALVFASGMAASGLTLYLAGLVHLI